MHQSLRLLGHELQQGEQSKYWILVGLIDDTKRPHLVLALLHDYVMLWRKLLMEVPCV